MAAPASCWGGRQPPRLVRGATVGLSRIADLPPWHPARADRGAALLRERQERDAATCSLPNPKLHRRPA